MALTKVKNRIFSDAPISLSESGAIGDGTTDDTSAIQNAFSNNTQSNILVDGNFLVSSTISIHNETSLVADNRKIYGFNASNFVGPYKSSLETTSAISIMKAERPVGGVTFANTIIEDMAFIGSNVSGQVGLEIQDMTNVIVRNCTFSNLDAALKFTGTNFVGLLTFENCKFIGCNQVTDIEVNYFNVVKFINCDIRDCTKGIVFDNSGNTMSIRNLVIRDSLFEEIEEESIYISGEFNATLIEGNYFESNIAAKVGPVIDLRSNADNAIPLATRINNNVFSEIIYDASSSVIRLANLKNINVKTNHSIFTDTVYASSGTSIRLLGTEYLYEIENLTTPTGQTAKPYNIFGETSGSYLSNIPERPENISAGEFSTGSADNFKFLAGSGFSDTGTILQLSRTGIKTYVQLNSCETSAATPSANHAVGVFFSGTTGRSINASGTINASGSDYAEYMKKSGDFILNKGDICGIDANGNLTNAYADAVSFVVKSTNPSYVGGDTWFNEEKPLDNASEDEVADFYNRLEQARSTVDRIAFCGQVPVNITGASVGDYIIPVDNNGSISSQSITDPTLEQYMMAVGKVIAIEDDGRARIIVKIS